ncbi:hypothetical protein ACP4OV_010058 [Aristida adscensionis]
MCALYALPVVIVAACIAKQMEAATPSRLHHLPNGRDQASHYHGFTVELAPRPPSLRPPRPPPLAPAPRRAPRGGRGDDGLHLRRGALGRRLCRGALGRGSAAAADGARGASRSSSALLRTRPAVVARSGGGSGAGARAEDCVREEDEDCGEEEDGRGGGEQRGRDAARGVRL